MAASSFMTSLNLPALCALVVCHYLYLFVYSRKVNDSNDSANIRMNENNPSSKDDIENLKYVRLVKLAKLSTDEEIHPSGSNEMRFANSEEIRRDHRLFDERRYEKEYTWLYYKFNKKGYLCKICEVFYRESSAKPGGSTGAWSHNAVIFKDNLGEKLTRHDKSETHKDAMNSLTNLKIKDQFEKID